MIEALAKAIIDGRWAYAEEILLLPASPLSLEGTGYGREFLDALLPSGQTLLDLAVEARHPAILRRLLDAGADPKVVNAAGDTPLITSCRGDFAIETGVLLEAGADPNYRTPDGWTALRCAAKDRNYAAVRILLMKGAVVADPEPWSAALDAFARTVAEEFAQ
jgi:ankyrin repeat protein